MTLINSCLSKQTCVALQFHLLLLEFLVNRRTSNGLYTKMMDITIELDNLY